MHWAFSTTNKDQGDRIREKLARIKWLVYKVLSQPTNPRCLILKLSKVFTDHRVSHSALYVHVSGMTIHVNGYACSHSAFQIDAHDPLDSRPGPPCASGYLKVINWCKERSCQHCSNRQNPIALDFLICVDFSRLNHRNLLRSDKDLSKAAEYPLVTHLLDSWKNHKLGPQGPRGRIVANAVSPSRRVPSRSPLLSNDDRICRRIRVPQQLCRTRCSLMKNVMLWM